MSNFFTYIFSEAEKKLLIKCLDFSINPYTHFQVFYEHIKTLIASNKISEDFSQACFSIKQMTLRHNPAFIFRNAPIDQYLPILDISNPLTSKYKLKKTFVSEAFLTVFAELCGNTILGYKNINNGDHFHDVAPMKTLLKS